MSADEHPAEAASVLDAGIGTSNVIVCRVCHVPVRTAGGLHPVHTSPRSRWCGYDCPNHEGRDRLNVAEIVR